MRVSASKTELLRACQWFARPDARWQRDDPGPAAQFGTATHDCIAFAVTHGAEPTHDDPRVLATARDVHAWWSHRFDADRAWLAEPAYVLDVATGRARLHGCNIGRAYPRLSDSEIAGSADLVSVHDGAAVVIDVKTGRRENVAPAERNAQMHTLALAVARAHAADVVHVVLAFVGPNGVTTDEHILDALDLAAWGDDLRVLVDAVPTSTPTPGKHCSGMYCPARVSCPAMTEALATVAPKTRLPIVTEASAITSPEHARHQYEVLRAAKTAIDAAWTAVRLYAEEHGGVDLGNGRAWGPKQTTRESIDLESRAALDALRSELGPSWEIAVTLETSKTAIKDAARDRAKATGEKIAAVEKRTIDALRGVGAVKATTSTTFDEYERKPALPEGESRTL